MAEIIGRIIENWDIPGVRAGYSFLDEPALLGRFRAVIDDEVNHMTAYVPPRLALTHDDSSFSRCMYGVRSTSGGLVVRSGHYSLRLFRYIYSDDIYIDFK